MIGDWYHLGGKKKTESTTESRETQEKKLEVEILLGIFLTRVRSLPELETKKKRELKPSRWPPAKGDLVGASALGCKVSCTGRE